jgi:RNA-binding protein YlmH
VGSLDKARAEDLLHLCKKRGFASGDFLSPAEEKVFLATLNALKKENAFFFSFEGGARGCQRRVPVLLSTDYEGLSPADFSEITPLLLKTTDGSTPDHRAVLGSLMALGLKRPVLGDIAKYGEGTLLFLKDRVAPYVQSELSRVGKSSIFFEEDFSLPTDFELVYEKEELHFSVSSLRLDCLVCAICRCAREQGADYVKKGLASVNFEEVSQPDKKLHPGDVLSLRGYGRFELARELSLTKSGRVHVTVYRYV